MEIRNDAPKYVIRDGGATWTIRMPCGSEISAVRDKSLAVWTVFHPEGQTTEVAGHFTDDQMIPYLKGLLRDSLIRSLALLV